MNREERYDYIEARAEAWFDNFREDPEYDFSKKGGNIERLQKATQLAYEGYAEGTLTLGGVADQCRMLRNAYKIRYEPT